MASRTITVCIALICCVLCAPCVAARGCEDLPLSSTDKIVFFAGNACRDDVVCRLTGIDNQRLEFNDAGCKNDRARSVCLLPGLDVGTLIIVTDDPDGRNVGDYAYIHVIGEITDRTCVSSFEWSALIDGVVKLDTEYAHGLDGKVSNV